MPVIQERLIEDYGSVVIGKNFVLEVETDSLAENLSFQIPAFADHLLYRVSVADAGYSLFDNRPLIQVLGDVMSGCADNLYSSFFGLVVWFGSDKSWEEGVVNIDYPAFSALDEIGRDYLHVAGEYNAINIVIFEQLYLRGLGFILVVCAYRYAMKLFLEVVGRTLHIWVITDDQGDLPFKLSLGFPAAADHTDSARSYCTLWLFVGGSHCTRASSSSFYSLLRVRVESLQYRLDRG